jgi:hypothetical protein
VNQCSTSKQSYRNSNNVYCNTTGTYDIIVRRPPITKNNQAKDTDEYCKYTYRSRLFRRQSREFLGQVMQNIWHSPLAKDRCDGLHSRLKHPWLEMQLSNAEWEQPEVLLMFLLPFKRCTARFECNSEYTEIDYVFFAYNTMYDHIDDVKAKLESDTGIGTLPCAKCILKAIGEMEVILKKYYQKTAFPTAYADGMILDPRSKLIIFGDPSWADASTEEYSNACRRRFVEMYDTSNATAASTASAYTVAASTSAAASGARNKKRPASQIDPEYRQALLSRLSKRRRNDYDRFIEIPNDPNIPSGIGWWRDHYRQYPALALMARDVLAVPASGCAVERQFSISGRMTVWQRNRLSPRVISNAMIFKAALTHTRYPLHAELDNVDDIDQLPAACR